MISRFIAKYIRPLNSHEQIVHSLRQHLTTEHKFHKAHVQVMVVGFSIDSSVFSFSNSPKIISTQLSASMRKKHKSVAQQQPPENKSKFLKRIHWNYVSLIFSSAIVPKPQITQKVFNFTELSFSLQPAFNPSACLH